MKAVLPRSVNAVMATDQTCVDGGRFDELMRLALAGISVAERLKKDER